MNRQIQIALLHSVGRWLADGARARRVVLCYHSVHSAGPGASATPEMFGRQLDWLTQRCRVVGLGRLLEEPAGDPAGPLVALTFDDGFADNYEHAFPALAIRGLPAVFFLTAGLIQKDPAVVARFQRLQPQTPVRPLEWGQIMEMAAAGMEFGAHTYSHPNLAVLSPRAAHHELRVARDILEQRLGAAAPGMAYPFGRRGLHFTSATVQAARFAGYRYAATIEYRPVRVLDSRFEVPRFAVTGDDLPEFSRKVLGEWDIVGRWQEKAPWWAARLAGSRAHRDFYSLAGFARTPAQATEGRLG